MTFTDEVMQALNKLINERFFGDHFGRIRLGSRWFELPRDYGKTLDGIGISCENSPDKTGGNDGR